MGIEIEYSSDTLVRGIVYFVTPARLLIMGENSETINRKKYF